MKDKIYGFLIDEEVLLDITKRRMVRFTDVSSINSMTIRVVSLNVTLVRLLTLLLTNKNETIISKNDILFYVFGRDNPSSSSQRVWHAINELKQKLSAIGLPDDFILNVRNSGYLINNHQISVLFHG